MERLRGKDLLLVGLTLFSMFFGAGNLIFPPYVGAQAGVNTWLAMVGMAVSAVGLPVLGVVAVAKAGGLDVMGDRIHPLFSRVFTVACYLAIGPCLAIPRTASTSFEMAVIPFAGAQAPLRLFQWAYTLVFFALALWVALKPEKLTDRLGKILCPILIALIVVAFAGCLLHPPGGYGPAQAAGYGDSPVITGFLEGYQTMDTIAALVFGITIAISIRARGVTQSREVVFGTVRAGCLAGILLLVIYAMLAHMGALAGGRFLGASNGARVLTDLVFYLFGPLGLMLLAAIFVIACFNVCVGLITSCGEYFHKLWPACSYRGWAAVFAGVGLLIANIGLDQILKISGPVLSVLYPVAIVLILLSLFHDRLKKRPRVYPAAILCTAAASLLLVAADYLPGLKEAVSIRPLAGQGLGWVLPAAVGLLAGLLLPQSA